MLNFIDMLRKFMQSMDSQPRFQTGIVRGYLVKLELLLIAIFIILLVLTVVVDMFLWCLDIWIGSLRKRREHFRSRNHRKKDDPVIVYREDPEFEELWKKYVEPKEGQQ